MMAKSFRWPILIPVAIVALLVGCGHSSTDSGTRKNGANASSKATGTAAIREAGQIAGSPSADSAQPLTDSETSQKDDRPVIVCFGDSLTAGYGTGPGHSYPDYLQRDLDARGYKYRVINAGISGNTSKDGVARLPRILALRPKVVLMDFGGNDGLRGIPISDTEKNLKTIISTLKRSGTKVILAGITLPPNYGRPYVHKFDVMYVRVAKEENIALLPFMLRNVENMPSGIQPDGIHATAKGNRQVAKNFLLYLLPLLKKPQVAKTPVGQ
jgi:acyl-CoA thioesterase-1